MTERIFFFFQAEDGIRDLVRSRGLGDVYKRQFISAGKFQCLCKFKISEEIQIQWKFDTYLQQAVAGRTRTVSYTHLTLPTSDLV